MQPLLPESVDQFLIQSRQIFQATTSYQRPQLLLDVSLRYMKRSQAVASVAIGDLSC
jgi:hypothetical protein